LGYEETVQAVRKILTYDTELKRTFGKYDSVAEGLKLMIDQLNELRDGKEVIPQPEQIEKIIKLTDGWLFHVIHNPHSKLFRDLTFHFVKLAGNWNNTLLKNSDVNLKLSLIDRLMLDMATISDAILVMRQLINSAKNLVRYQPPMFDVARHYADSINEQLDVKKESSGST